MDDRASWYGKGFWHLTTVHQTRRTQRYSATDCQSHRRLSALRAMFRNEEVYRCTDSWCLFDTIITLCEARDFLLRPTMQRICNSFESHDLNHMPWIAGESNPSDALTKWNSKRWMLLNQKFANKVLCISVLCISVEAEYDGDTQLWQWIASITET